MPTTLGLVVSLDTDCPNSPIETCRLLEAHPDLSLGELQDRWLPIAAIAEDHPACMALHDWISEQQGVAYVDVVHVNFDDASSDHDSSLELSTSSPST